MKNIKLLLLFILPSLLILVPTVMAQEEDDGLTIGFSQVGSESGWRVSFTNATIAEAEARGINLIFSDGENSQEIQI